MLIPKLEKIFQENCFKTGKIFFEKSQKNRTLLALKLENSILKNGKKNEHYYH